MKKIDWKALLLSLAVSLGTGTISALLTADTMEKYQELYKPPLAPPGWVFPVVWTILFVLMGISAWMVFESDSPEKKQALTLYGIQLLVNAVWPLIFFKFELYFLAFAWLLLLWYLVFITTVKFYKIREAAGILLVPYLLWIAFAGYLNLAVAVHYW